MRLSIVAAVLALAAACVPAGPRTLVYAFDDGEPEGTLDRDRCIVGAGLRLSLGPTESIAFDIASDQQTARLATCDLEGSSVQSCGVLDPEIPLEIDANVVTGVGSVPVTFTETDCSGADLTSTWTMTLDDGEQHLDASVELEWVLHDTPECAAFEAQVLQAFPDSSGRIDGCIVTYAFGATQVAECRISGTELRCD
ncbi:MAG: hypothetical protein H6737_09430 [Alphaproteobacteria bacterium]|nr:hypothetical protein [Alphaproteobacteria bacterium]